jgi:hypothetical protein
MTVAVDEPQASAGILEFASRLRNLDAAAMDEEFSTVLQAAGDTPTVTSSLQLALLLSHPNSAHYDLEAATAMLDGVMADTTSDADVRGVASLLLMLLVDRRRLDADRDELVARQLLYRETVPDTPVAPQAAGIEEAEDRVRRLLAELEQERERGRKLEAQLQGLIELEEQLKQGAEALDE